MKLYKNRKSNIHRHGLSAATNIKKGQKIIQYKGKKYDIFDTDSYEEALNNFTSGNKIALHLTRNGSRIIRSITIN